MKLQGIKRRVSRLLYEASLQPLKALSAFLVPVFKKRCAPGSVLHVDHMAHVAADTVEILRRHGVDARFLGRGRELTSSRADYPFRPSRIPPFMALQEFIFLWTVLAKFETVHIHRLCAMSLSGWEIPVLKRLGRRLVIHYRGCEIRDWRLNMRLHPDCNICQDCDYGRVLCENELVAERRALAGRHGDVFLVTTPDMKDFAPEAEHLPFFVPPSLPPRKETRSAAGLPFKIVHATNHPGIEGTARIEAAVDALRKKGFSIDFVFLKGVPHERVLAELVDADLSIGKMKMGYYANAQVESMAMGVPTLTWIRPDLMTDALRQSGLIVCSLDELEAVLERCLRNPEELRASGLECRRSVGKLHDNDAIAKRLIELYRGGRA